MAENKKRYDSAKEKRSSHKSTRDKHVAAMRAAKKSGDTAQWKKSKAKVVATSKLMRAQAHVMHKNSSKEHIAKLTAKGTKHWGDKTESYNKRIKNVESKGGATKDWSKEKRAATMKKLVAALAKTKKRGTAHAKRMARYK